VCGRYAASRRPEDLVEEFEVEATEGTGPGDDPASASADFNVAPTKQAPVVLERVPRAAPAGQALEDAAAPEAVRWLRLLTWGLVPSWATGRSVGYKMINARAETLLDKPAFKRAALSRRCLVPADGWYEWQVSPSLKDAKGKPRKQPFFMRPISGGPIAFAGVYELWRDPDRHADGPSAWLAGYAVVTAAAEPGLDVIHDRMPFVLPADRWDDWLDPEQRDPDAVRALLQPPVAGRFEAVPVSTTVNSVRSNGPELLEPVPWEDLHGVVDPRTGELIGAGSPHEDG
jgi:putative SOS response-associated peptidase YedK